MKALKLPLFNDEKDDLDAYPEQEKMYFKC